MRPRPKPLLILAALLLGGGVAGFLLLPARTGLRRALETSGDYPVLEIQHPIAGAVMPRNMPAPVVTWKTNAAGGEEWLVAFKAGGLAWWFERIQPMWRPNDRVWREIKDAARAGPIEVIIGAFGKDSRRLQARGAVRFTLSRDTVDHPLFYREVNLPFSEAVKDPSKIRWRFGALDQGTLPPVVLEKLPVCGNCHSFDRKGEFLAMDVDYANSKASYVITRIAPEMRLATSDIICWDDYRREDGQQTFGLLSQISPDGRYVVSTVKDRSVFVARPDLAFSQLFFPLKGILAVYDRDARQYASLPGADDPAFVQSNPAWSPDGQWVVFARNRAAELEKPGKTGSILLTPEECEEFLKRGKEFKYELWRVPFNAGKGGKAEPLRGASGNGRSNFFPKYSPDGRWLVFCQASNYMLLQPDSELYIIPAAGGEARRLGCNLSRMNSWHTWSPDSKWLVFSSKAHSDYTQLYLTRIDERGEASPPVWLEHMVAPGRAANIPEFVALAPDAIVKVREQFLDDYSFTRAGNEFFDAGDADPAIAKYRIALSMNPNNAMAHQRLGFLLYRVKHQPEEAMEHTRTAVRLEARNPFAQFDLGAALAEHGDLTNAVVHLAEAARLLPNGYDRTYNAIEMHLILAQTQYRLALYAQCIPALETVLRLAPEHARANYLMAMTRAWLGETRPTLPFFEQAVHAEPHLGQLPDFFDLLSRNYLNQGLYDEGLKTSEQAARLAATAGRSQQAAKLQQRAEECRRRGGIEKR
jgi:tetratricopeptide (TPR) repeat protein